MTTELTRQVMTEYLEVFSARGDFTRFLSDDVVFRVMGTDQQAHGRDGAEQAIRYVHQVAFDDHVKVVNLMVQDEHAAVEFELVGTHTAEFAGVAASGNAVRLPYCVCYTVHRDKIADYRVYVAMDVLIGQIRHGTVQGQPAT